VIEGIGRSQTNWTDYCWDPPLGVSYPRASRPFATQSKASPNLLSIDAARGHHRQRRLVAMRPVGGQQIGAQQGFQRR
jgi:hypothetical protein